jgi:hypothetical protein
MCLTINIHRFKKSLRGEKGTSLVFGAGQEFSRRHQLPNNTLGVSEIFPQHHIVAPPNLLSIQCWHRASFSSRQTVDASPLVGLTVSS